MSSTEREEKLYQAKLAEQAERYDEMKSAMTRVVELDPRLSRDERNLLSLAFKNDIGGRRSSWRIVTSAEQREDSNGQNSHVGLIKGYRARIEAELAAICNELLTLVEKKLIPAAEDAEAKVFFYKMKGDYHRYYAEVDPGETQKNLALQAYKDATAAAEALLPTHPVRLGLALNFSVFYYEICKDTQQGCALAREAFDAGVQSLGTLDEESYKESTLILQLLRDNLTLWREDNPSAGGADETQVEDVQ